MAIKNTANVFRKADLENILLALQTARPDGAQYFDLVRKALGIDEGAVHSWTVLEPRKRLEQRR